MFCYCPLSKLYPLFCACVEPILYIIHKVKYSVSISLRHLYQYFEQYGPGIINLPIIFVALSLNASQRKPPVIQQPRFQRCKLPDFWPSNPVLWFAMGPSSTLKFWAWSRRGSSLCTRQMPCSMMLSPLLQIGYPASGCSALFSLCTLSPADRCTDGWKNSGDAGDVG